MANWMEEAYSLPDWPECPWSDLIPPGIAVKRGIVEEQDCLVLLLDSPRGANIAKVRIKELDEEGVKIALENFGLALIPGKRLIRSSSWSTSLRKSLKSSTPGKRLT